MDLKEIQKRNYQATVKRGLINETTTKKDFIYKIFEELCELNISAKEMVLEQFDEIELADIIIVCLCMAKHFNVDIEKVMEKKTLYNEKRKD